MSHGIITNEDKEFAHISNDSSIAGTGLEGGNLGVFCDFLIKLPSKLEENNVNKLAANILGNLSEQILLIKNTNNNPSGINGANTLIYNQLNKFKPDYKPIAFTSGWVGTTQYIGHLIIAQLQYDKENNLILIIHNTGGGIQFHTQKPGWKGKLSATELVYKIPKDEATEDNVKYLINVLITPGYTPIVDPDKHIDAAQMFYVQLSEVMHRLKAEKLNPEVYNTSYSVGQRAGTCTWKSLMAFIKNSINDNQKYLLIKYEIKLKALLEYYNKQKTNGRLDSTQLVREQINFACENLARIIKKLDKADKEINAEPIFSKERRNAGLKEIWRIRGEVSSKPLKPMQGEPLVFPENITAIKLQIEPQDILTDNKEDMHETQTGKQYKNISLSFKNLSESIENIYNFSSDEQISTFERLIALEQVINDINLPFDDGFIRSMNLKDRTALAGKIADLSHLHMYLCGMQNNVLRYDSLITSMTLNHIILKLSEELLNIENFNKNPQGPLIAYSFIEKTLFDINNEFEKPIITYNAALTNKWEYLKQTISTWLKPFELLTKTAGVKPTEKIYDITELCKLFSTDRNILVKLFSTDINIKELYLPLYQSSAIVKTFTNQNVMVIAQKLTARVDRISTCLAGKTIKNNYVEKFTLDYRRMYMPRQLTRVNANHAFGICSFLKGPLSYDVNIYSATIQDPEVAICYRVHSTITNNRCNEINELFINMRSNESFELKFLYDLYSIYLAGDSKISYLYDIISRYPNKLNYTATQDIIFTQLFMNNSIDKQAFRAPEGILDLAKLLKNTQAIQNNQSESGWLFIVKLAIYIKGYVEKLPNDMINNANIIEALDILSRIENNVELLLRNDPENINLRMLQAKSIQTISDANITDVLIGQILLNSRYNIVNEQPYTPLLERTMIQDTIVRHNNQIREILTKDTQNKILKSVVKVITGKDISDIHGDYPLFTYTEGHDKCRINFSSGKMFYSNELTTQTPLNIFSTKLYNNYFGNQLYTGKLSAAQKRFSFTDNQIKYIINQNHSEEQSLFREFSWPNENQMYQLIDNAEKIKNTFYRHIPSTLIDQNCDIWMSSLNFIITDKKTKKETYYISNNNITTADNKRKLVYIFTDPKNLLVKKLLDFEDESFIEAWQSITENNIYNIKFPRYNFEFITTDSGKTFIWGADNRYKIDSNPLSGLMHGFEHYLMLTPVDSSSSLSSIILTPQQDIIFDIEYGINRLDTNCEIKMRDKIRKSLGAGKIYLDKNEKKPQEQITALREATTQFNYQSSENFTVLGVDKAGGNIQPRSCIEYLHLAYIYLGTNKVPESLELLRKALQAFTGSKEEILWLTKIMSSMPSFIPLTKEEELTYKKRNSAEHSATRAFAAFIIATKMEGINQLDKDLQKQIQSTAVTCLKDYYNTLNNIPDTMILNKTQELLSLQEFNISSARIQQLREELVASVKIPLKFNSTTAAASFSEAKIKILLKMDDHYNGMNYRLYNICLEYSVKQNKLYTNVAKKINQLTDFREILLSFPEVIKIISNPNNTNYKKYASLIDTFVKIFNDPIGNAFSLKSSLESLNSNAIRSFFDILKYVYLYPDSIGEFDLSSLTSLAEESSTNRDFFQFIQKKYKDSNTPLYVEYENPLHTASPVIFPNTPNFGISRLANPNGSDLESIEHAIINIKQNANLDLTSADVYNSNPSKPYAGANFKMILQAELDEDIRIGEEKNEIAIRHQNNNIKILTNDKLQKIYKNTNSLCLELQEKLNEKQSTIMQLANQEPENKTQYIQLELAARNKHKITFPEILRLFLQQNKFYYEQQTFLDEASILALQQNIFDYLIDATKLQLLNKIKTLSLDITQTNDPTIKKFKTQELDTLLKSKRTYNPAENPSMLLFEYLDNKLIREDQVTYFSELLSKDKSGNYPNILCQMIMGGGKSKVLLPILAQQKANGDMLSIVIVSKDMYQTNVCDLTKVSSELFGQKTYELLFTRSTNVSDNFFEKLYYKLLACIIDQDYIITTPESIQSLELKYLEMLKSSTDPSKSLDHLENILKLIKTRGDAIIDEADQNLQTSKELNYAIGAEQSIATKYPNIINDAIDFYEFLENNYDISDYINGQNVLLGELQKNEFLKQLIKELSDRSDSILYKIITSNSTPIKLENIDKQVLNDYLGNKTAKIPNFFELCTPETKNRLAFLRENLSGLLTNTLSKHKNENYGLRQSPGKPIKSNIAVPYVGAQTPSKSSEFASILEQINYTIQSHIGHEVNETVFRLIITSFKDQYLFAIKYSDAISTNTAIRINEEFKEITGINEELQNITIDDADRMRVFYNLTKNNSKLKKYALTNFILPGISSNDLLLKSNMHDLLRLFKSVQGFTGTPYNHRTLAPFLEYKSNLNSGVDGQTVGNIKRNTSGIIKSSAENLYDLLNSIKDKKQIRALIDQGAHCKNISNKLAAEQIRDAYKNTEITHVLYFNNDNILTALPMNNQLPAVSLKSSDPSVIYETIHAKPEQCFTYYDQRHATGIDIKQAEDACALVTISETTIFRDVLQSAMRMRKLAANQTLQFVIPPQIADTINSVDDIIEFTFKNQMEQLSNDHYRAAKQQITSIIRADLFQRILNSSEEQKKLYISTFKSFLYSENSGSIFDQYGYAFIETGAEASLNVFANNKLEVWRMTLQQLDINDEKSYARIENEFKIIIDSAWKTCKEKVLTGETIINGSEQEQELEQEQEQEQEQETQKSYNNFQALDRVTITSQIPLLLNIAGQHSPKTIDQFPSVNDICHNLKHKAWDFDNSIYISTNAAFVFKGQDIILEAKKDIYDIMIIMHNSTEGPIYVLLDPEDAEEIVQYCNDHNITQHVIIQSMYGHVSFNSRPGNISKPPNYEMIMQQIAFYNGEAGLLVRHQEWIKQGDHVSKMKFLENIISNCHPGKMPQLKDLKNIYDMQIKGYGSLLNENTEQVTKEPADTAATAAKVAASVTPSQPVDSDTLHSDSSSKMSFLTTFKNFIYVWLVSPLITFFQTLVSIFTKAPHGKEYSDTTQNKEMNLPIIRDSAMHINKECFDLNQKIQARFQLISKDLKNELVSAKNEIEKQNILCRINIHEQNTSRIQYAYDSKDINMFCNLLEEYVNNITAVYRKEQTELLFREIYPLINTVEKQIHTLTSDDISRLNMAFELNDVVEMLKIPSEGYRLHTAIIDGAYNDVLKILAEGNSYELTCVNKENNIALQVAFQSKTMNNEKPGGYGTRILTALLESMQKLDLKLNEAINNNEDPKIVQKFIPQNESIILYALRKKNDKLFYYALEHHKKFKATHNMTHIDEPVSFYVAKTNDPDKIKALLQIEENIRRPSF